MAPMITHPTRSFLSTPSARRATYVQQSHLEPHRISIHALCEEGDLAVSIWLETL